MVSGATPESEPQPLTVRTSAARASRGNRDTRPIVGSAGPAIVARHAKRPFRLGRVGISGRTHPGHEISGGARGAQVRVRSSTAGKYAGTRGRVPRRGRPVARGTVAATVLALAVTGCTNGGTTR